MTVAAETLEASAQRIGRHAWVEQNLFETVGGWVTSTPEPAAKAVLAAQSLHHAWRAEQWYGLLPAVPHLAVEDLVTPPPDVLPLPGDETAARLAWLVDQALPRLLAAYADHLAATAPLTDGPTIRILGLVTADVRADLAAAEALRPAGIPEA